MTSNTTASSNFYCRQCGYMLAESSKPRCPECGRRFGPKRRSPFDRRPVAWRVRWLTRRLLAIFGPLVVLVGGTIGWVYWRCYPDWRTEQYFVRHWPINSRANFRPDRSTWLRKLPNL